MALGALARMEAEGEPADVIERFKSAIRGSLGVLGDRLVWVGLRPVCLLLALVLALGGAAWWVAVAAFLVCYNAGHLLLRAWAFRLGLTRGRGVGEELRRSSVPQLHRALSVAGAFLVGVALPLVAAGRLAPARGALQDAAAGAPPGGLPFALSGALPDTLPQALPWLLAGAAAAALGARFGAAVQRPIVLAIVGFALVGLILGAIR
jgi:mannose/fructose/N-acetylgalactosamine-specific phosphotransferase system component IID